MTTPSRARHLGTDELREILAGRGARARRVHATSCRSCAGELEALAVLAAERAAASATCPDAFDLSRHASGVLAAGADARVGLHVARCRRCAADVERATTAARSGGPLPGAALSSRPRSLIRALRDLVSFELPVYTFVLARSATTAETGAYERAMTHYAAGRLAKARDLLERALREGDDGAEVRFYLGACLAKAGRWREALPHLRAAVTASPRLVEYRWFLAQALLASGRGDEALKELTRVGRAAGTWRTQARSLAKVLRETLDSEK